MVQTLESRLYQRTNMMFNITVGTKLGVWENKQSKDSETKLSWQTQKKDKTGGSIG